MRGKLRNEGFQRNPRLGKACQTSTDVRHQPNSNKPLKHKAITLVQESQAKQLSGTRKKRNGEENETKKIDYSSKKSAIATHRLIKDIS